MPRGRCGHDADGTITSVVAADVTAVDVTAAAARGSRILTEKPPAPVGSSRADRTGRAGGRPARSPRTAVALALARNEAG
jgi:hypothetical protein